VGVDHFDDHSRILAHSSVFGVILCQHRGPLDLWNEWATKILVLLSLTLQVVLLLLAGIRCREASPTPKFILWLAYQLSDSTAIYTIGHPSLSNVLVKH